MDCPLYRSMSGTCLDRVCPLNSAITGTCVGLGNCLDPPIHSSGKPVPGFDVRIMREDGTEADKPGELGRIVCKMPMAPGTMMTLYNAPDRFKEAYFDKFPVRFRYAFSFLV